MSMSGRLNQADEDDRTRQTLVAFAKLLHGEGQLGEFCSRRYLSIAVDNPYVVGDREFWAAARDFFQDEKVVQPGGGEACRIDREQYLDGVAGLLDAA